MDHADEALDCLQNPTAEASCGSSCGWWADLFRTQWSKPPGLLGDQTLGLTLLRGLALGRSLALGWFMFLVRGLAPGQGLAPGTVNPLG